MHYTNSGHSYDQSCRWFVSKFPPRCPKPPKPVTIPPCNLRDKILPFDFLTGVNRYQAKLVAARRLRRNVLLEQPAKVENIQQNCLSPLRGRNVLHSYLQPASILSWAILQEHVCLCEFLFGCILHDQRHQLKQKYAIWMSTINGHNLYQIEPLLHDDRILALSGH